MNNGGIVLGQILLDLNNPHDHLTRFSILPDLPEGDIGLQYTVYPVGTGYEAGNRSAGDKPGICDTGQGFPVFRTSDVRFSDQFLLCRIGDDIDLRIEDRHRFNIQALGKSFDDPVEDLELFGIGERDTPVAHHRRDDKSPKHLLIQIFRQKQRVVFTLFQHDLPGMIGDQPG